MRKLFGILVLASLLGSIGGAFAKTTAPISSARVPGWYLKQHLDYQGDTEVRATNTVCKVHTKDLTMYVMHNKPAIVFNETNKTKMEVPRRVWLDQHQMKGTLTTVCPPKILKELKMPMSSARMIAGHKCTQHWAGTNSHDGRFLFWCEYWTASDIKLPNDMVADYFSVLGLPSGDGIPLDAVRHKNFHQPNHKIFVLLKTFEAKPATYLMSELVPPVTGYKQVKDEIDLMLGSADDEITRLMKDPKRR